MIQLQSSRGRKLSSSCLPNKPSGSVQRCVRVAHAAASPRSISFPSPHLPLLSRCSVYLAPHCFLLPMHHSLHLAFCRPLVIAFQRLHPTPTCLLMASLPLSQSPLGELLTPIRSPSTPLPSLNCSTTYSYPPPVHSQLKAWPHHHTRLRCARLQADCTMRCVLSPSPAPLVATPDAALPTQP